MSMRLLFLRWHTFAVSILLVLAAIFYFWQLSRPDIVTDESSYATRSIGMVDFDFGIEQPTPWQWVDHVPAWMHLSFHDDPPIVFLLQHISMGLFGENPFAIRFPSVIAGLISILLLYFIGKRLYSAEVGLVAAAIFAFTVNHVWISRIGLLESIVIAFMLASMWAFLKGLPPAVSGRGSPPLRGGGEHPAWLMPAGIFLGLAFLSKYTALVLIPIFLIILFVRRRDLLKSRYFLFSIFLFLVVASPVIIYNIELWQHFGHFDFQFSLLFHQDVKEWQARPGQESLGSYGNRIRHYLPWLVDANSPYLLIIAGFAMLLMLWEHLRTRHRMHGEVLLAIFLLAPFFVFIGPTGRFFSLLTPWLAIASAYLLAKVPWRKTSLAITTVFVALELFYSANSVIMLNPIGVIPWTYAKLHGETGSWGFNELEEYARQEFNGKAPEIAISFQFPFAKEILNSAIDHARTAHREFVPVGIVYNDNINLSASLWTFLRRIVYQGWPITTAEDFQHSQSAFFSQSSIKTIYFVNPTGEALQDRPRAPTQDGDIIAQMLESRGVHPIEIKNPHGEVAFRVYQFVLK